MPSRLARLIDELPCRVPRSRQARTSFTRVRNFYPPGFPRYLRVFGTVSTTSANSLIFVSTAAEGVCARHERCLQFVRAEALVSRMRSSSSKLGLRHCQPATPQGKEAAGAVRFNMQRNRAGFQRQPGLTWLSRLGSEPTLSASSQKRLRTTSWSATGVGIALSCAVASKARAGGRSRGATGVALLRGTRRSSPNRGRVGCCFCGEAAARHCSEVER